MIMKKCPVCKADVKGRKDKIYCSETCKSSHQYEKRTKNESFYLHVDRQLKINRKILKRCKAFYEEDTCNHFNFFGTWDSLCAGQVII